MSRSPARTTADSGSLWRKRSSPYCELSVAIVPSLYVSQGHGSLFSNSPIALCFSRSLQPVAPIPLLTQNTLFAHFADFEVSSSLGGVLLAFWRLSRYKRGGHHSDCVAYCSEMGHYEFGVRVWVLQTLQPQNLWGGGNFYTPLPPPLKNILCRVGGSMKACRGSLQNIQPPPLSLKKCLPPKKLQGGACNFLPGLWSQQSHKSEECQKPHLPLLLKDVLQHTSNLHSNATPTCIAMLRRP